MKRLSRDRQGIIGAILAAIVLLIVVIIVAALLLIPFNSVAVDESRRAALESGVEALDLSLSIDAGRVAVRFVDDVETAVTLNVSGHHRSGLLGPGNGLNVTWEESTSDGTLSVNSTVTLSDSIIPFFSSDIGCVLLISKELRTSLAITSSVGGLELEAGEDVELESVDLFTTTGGVRANIDNATLNGPLKLRTTTGGVDMSWRNVQAGDNATAELRTSTGGVRADIVQTAGLGSNVTVAAAATTGGIEMSMDLQGNTSARISSSASLGGIGIEDRTGFSGPDGDLRSTNYASDSNFEVTLSTNTGGVSINARYAA